MVQLRNAGDKYRRGYVRKQTSYIIGNPEKYPPGWKYNLFVFLRFLALATFYGTDVPITFCKFSKYRLTEIPKYHDNMISCVNKTKLIDDSFRYLGTKKELDLKFKAKLYNKLFRFTKISENSWRFGFPQALVKEMEIDENTHYVLWHSREVMNVALFLTSFSDMMRNMRFSAGESDSIEKRSARKRNTEREITELTYTLKGMGAFSGTPRKVWVARTRKGKKVYTKYGALIPWDVALQMGIKRDTRYIILYSPENEAMILELRNLKYVDNKVQNTQESVFVDEVNYEENMGNWQEEDEEVVEVKT